MHKLVKMSGVMIDALIHTMEIMRICHVKMYIHKWVCLSYQM